MKNKYYYIKYEQNDPDRLIKGHCVSNEHPFKWISFYNKEHRTLKYWKEISGEEYTLGKETINRE